MDIIKAFVELIDGLLKNPIMTPIYIAILILSLAIVLYKVKTKFMTEAKVELKEVKDEIKEAIKEELSNINKKFDNQALTTQYITQNENVYKEIIENLPVIKYFADNFKDSHKDVFSDIQTQLHYMLDSFLKNCVDNGSHEEKANEDMVFTRIKILESMELFSVNEPFKCVIIAFLNVFEDRTKALIEELKIMSNANMKMSLISKHFQNFFLVMHQTKVEAIRYSQCQEVKEVEKNILEILSRVDIKRTNFVSDEIAAHLSGYK